MWHVSQAFRTKSLTMDWVSSAFLAREASRSLSASVSRFLAAAWNSDHFCQISGLALDLSVSEPSGKRAGEL